MRVFAYDFATQLCPGESENSRGYWRDVGTLDAYFDASMDLVSVDPRLNLYNEDWPIRGLSPPPAQFVPDERWPRGHGAIRSSARD
jgi:glucose-1-phosphate adenylyltransferase